MRQVSSVAGCATDSGKYKNPRMCNRKQVNHF